MRRNKSIWISRTTTRSSMSNVKLIAITKPVIEECETAEELIAYCARVSNPNNQANHGTAGKLLKYCADHAHWSIFETASMTVEIQCTRDIGRQIIRHRSCKFQEFSQRYAEVTDDSFEISEARLQDAKNRQSSLETDDQELQAWWTAAQEEVRDLAVQKYQQALQKGIAKEVSRKVLPEGITLTTMYLTGDIRSFIHYCILRCDDATQKEHRIIAQEIKRILLEQFPSLTELFDSAIVVDYKELLGKYINHVGEQEGTAFLSDRHKELFTDEEWEVLTRW